MPGNPNMGYVKIAFSYGLRVLVYLMKGKEERLNAQMYKKWMHWIIKQAGDTDTNGAIAGGLMGSVIGFWQLPVRYVVRSLKTVTDLRSLTIADTEAQPLNTPKSKYHAPHRPSFYEPCSTLLTALDMVERCESYR
jgi:hypothetical protein